MIEQSLLDAHDKQLWHDHRYDRPNPSRDEAFQRVLDNRGYLTEVVENSEAVKNCVIGMFKAMLSGNERSMDAFERDLLKCFTDELDGYVDIEIEKMEKECD